MFGFGVKVRKALNNTDDRLPNRSHFLEGDKLLVPCHYAKSKHHYVNLRLKAPKLDCASALAIDISKKSFETFDGQQYRKFGSEQIQDLLRLRPERVYLESTGVYHRKIVKALLAENVLVFEVNTYRFKKFREQYQPDVKTDKSDVQAIWEFAKLFQQKRLESVSNPLEPLLNRHKLLSNTLVQWTGVLEASKHSEQQDNVIFIKGIMKLLRKAKRETEDKLRIMLPERLVKEYGLILTGHLCNHCPGRFPTSRQWASSLGFKLKTYESGTIIKKRSITKRGPSKARCCLYLAVMSKIQSKSEPYCSYHRRLKDRGMLGRKVMVAVMRKMARRFWAEWHSVQSV